MKHFFTIIFSFFTIFCSFLSIQPIFVSAYASNSANIGIKTRFDTEKYKFSSNLENYQTVAELEQYPGGEEISTLAEENSSADNLSDASDSESQPDSTKDNGQVDDANSDATIEEATDNNQNETSSDDTLSDDSSTKQDDTEDIAPSDSSQHKNKRILIAFVIDDFGGWERAGVDELLLSNIPITCAIIPFVDNSKADYQEALQNGKEVILHMPMQAHVYLPESWYGPVYITNYESPAEATTKLEKCLQTMPEAKGFNIHIGSGASRNLELMTEMYKYADAHNLFFLDSRTTLDGKCQGACEAADSTYLGRDVFLEPEKNRSYSGVCNRINEAAQIAEDKGYAIVIGHVGAEGGTNTAKAIIDTYPTLSSRGIEVVPLSEIYKQVKAERSA